jgi:hypothetical protein
MRGPVDVRTVASAIGPPRAGVLVTELDGDLTLYDPAGNLVHVLNQSAGDIWRLLDGERHLDEVVEVIAEGYATEVDEVRPHVVQTVARFVELDLIPAVDLP